MKAIVEMFNQGRYSEAGVQLQELTQRYPQHGFGWKVLGPVLNLLGREVEAFAALQKAVELMPDDAETHSNLGKALRDQARLAEAETCYRTAVKLMPGSVDARINLSVVLDQLVPAWHIPMVNDERRNQAYLEALEAAVMPDSNVLEIGTGSGLLAMIAARCGARHVATCEAVPLIAATARDIIAANGLQASINVIPKKPRKLRLASTCPGAPICWCRKSCRANCWGKASCRALKTRSDGCSSPTPK